MKGRVLLVEDDANLATMVAARLRHEGYAVEVCGTGRDGLARSVAGSFRATSMVNSAAFARRRVTRATWMDRPRRAH